jgi:hypothetical protein
MAPHTPDRVSLPPYCGFQKEEIMSRNTFARLGGTLFLIVAIVHALRLILKWQVIIGGWSVPMWISVVGVIIPAYLAYEGLKNSKGE